jgi:hypothetical protein
MKNLKDLEVKGLNHTTWRKFIDGCSFEDWALTREYGGDYIVEESTNVELLDQPDVEYNTEKKLVCWGIPVVIEDFDNFVRFYLIYTWNEVTLEYKAYPTAFWSEKEAWDYINEVLR